MAAQRIPPNFFSISFGLAGLGESWAIAANEGHVSTGVGDAIFVVSAVVWLATLVLYLRYALAASGVLRADLTDKAVGPFASLALITPLLLAAEGLAPHAPEAGKVLVDIFLVLTLLLGGWYTGQWIYGQLELDALHPGYFLPTVAGGLIAADAAAAVGQLRLAQVMFGLGIVCWLILGSIIMGRLFFRPLPPMPLQPTLAIEVAPPAVGSIAYLDINGGRLDIFAAGIAGYGLLMVLAQLRLFPAYRRLHFAPSTWAFTFSYAAVITTVLIWNDIGRPDGQAVYAYLLLAAITLFIGGISVRTLIAAARGSLLPPPNPPAAHPH